MTIGEIFRQFTEQQASGKKTCPTHPDGCPPLSDLIMGLVNDMRRSADDLETIVNLLRNAKTPAELAEAETAVRNLLTLAARMRGF